MNNPQQPKPRAKITNYIVQDQRLYGEVTEHPRQGDFPSGWVSTSRIVKLDLEKKECETLHTIYELGEPLKLS